MAKVAVRQMEGAPESELPAGIEADGARCYSVLCSEKDPIHLHRVMLDTGGRMNWTEARLGQIAYVAAGEVEIDGAHLGPQSCIVIEHGAKTSLKVAQAAELYLFISVDRSLAPDLRAGGHVHYIQSAEVPRSTDFFGDGRIGGSLFADAHCPTCELWLHGTDVNREAAETPVHSHNEDEVIVVTRGEIVLGRKRGGPGTVIAVARDTLYGFHSGEGGLSFINFRPRSPVYVPADKTKPAVDERELMVAHMAKPARHLIGDARSVSA